MVLSLSTANNVFNEVKSEGFGVRRMRLVYEAENVLSPESLDRIRIIEAGLRALPGFEKLCRGETLFPRAHSSGLRAVPW